jgi:hypothetical protein
MRVMQTPKTRREFERNFHLLREATRLGKFHVSSQATQSVDSLVKVRSLPNGRIDFLSVDELARLQANSMANFPSEEMIDALSTD